VKQTHQQRMPLIQVPTVRDITGLRRDEIFDRVDGKSLLHRGFVWVWDMSSTFPGNITRDLRFWRAEVEASDIEAASLARLELAAVVDQILPASRSNFHSGELIQMFAISRPGLQRLRDELNGNLLGARNALFSRKNVAACLTRRWVGVVPSWAAKPKEGLVTK
jgi:hypothetical protein